MLHKFSICCGTEIGHVIELLNLAPKNSLVCGIHRIEEAIVLKEVPVWYNRSTLLSMSQSRIIGNSNVRFLTSREFTN
jgi:hypothetical protein